MKEITLSRKFWRPTATEKADNICTDAKIEGLVVASPRDLDGRYGPERVVDIQVAPSAIVTVRLRGFLGSLWDSAPADLRAPGRTVCFHFKGLGAPTATAPKGRPQFAFYVDA